MVFFTYTQILIEHSGVPDQTVQNRALHVLKGKTQSSDGSRTGFTKSILHCLSMSHEKDARLISHGLLTYHSSTVPPYNTDLYITRLCCGSQILLQWNFTWSFSYYSFVNLSL